MKLADLGKREMAIIYILGFVLSAALLYKFVVSPELERYRTGNDRFGSQQQRKMRAVSQRDALLDEYLVLKAKADKMKKLLFNKVEADDFQEQLPKLSEQTGNDLTSITPKDSHALVRTGAKKSREKISEEEAKKAAQLSEIAQMPIGVTISGEYGNIIKLFNTLEGFKELMVVSDVGVSSSRGSAGEVETRFSLNLIHTRTDMRATTGELLVDVSAMSQLPVEGAQQEKTSPPVRAADTRSDSDTRQLR